MARYKVLKSVAHSFGHSFTSLMNYRGDDYVMGHLLRRAQEVDEDTLRVDILARKAEPRSLLVKDVAASVDEYCDWFPRIVEAHRTEMRYVRAARMTIQFDLKVRRPVRYAPTYFESPFTCLVEIQDDRGKVWAAELKDWWYPESGTLAPKHSILTSMRQRLGQFIRTVWTRPSAPLRLQPNER
jgi:hypothetical protein